MEPVKAYIFREGSCYGYIKGHILRRSYIPDDLQNIMEMLDSTGNMYPELMEAVYSIFTNQGRLRQEYLEDGTQEGTAVWGKELDRGNLFVVEKACVNEPGRGLPVCRTLFRAVIDRLARESSRHLYVFARPESFRVQYSPVEEINSDMTEFQDNEHFLGMSGETPKTFWKDAGFRRLGTSEWLAFAATDRHHISHMVPKDEDYESPGTAA